MSNFKIHSPFKPCGDQPAAIDRLYDGLSGGKSFQTLLGVTGSGETFTMANVIARYGKPALVISHNKTLAAQLYEELKEKVTIIKDMRTTFYGKREFYIRDCNGYILTFAGGV